MRGKPTESLEHRRDPSLGVVDVGVVLERHLPEHVRQPLFRLLPLCACVCVMGAASEKKNQPRVLLRPWCIDIIVDEGGSAEPKHSR